MFPDAQRGAFGFGLFGAREPVRLCPSDNRRPDLLATINSLMRDEAATSFTPAAGQDFAAYADALIARFKNPALNHRLAQIAMDDRGFLLMRVRA